MVEDKREKLKKFGVSYHKTKILVPYPRNPRRGKCEGCGRKRGKEIKTTQLHHHIYAYETKTVKKNPLLALDNTSEFCFNPCHKAADALRALTAEINPKNYDKVVNVSKLMPPWMQDRFTKLCRLWLKEVKKNHGKK